MFNLKTKIDSNGFWYLIDSETDVVFTLNYFVVGSQGRFSSGEIKGFTSQKGWQFCNTEVQPLHVGITKLQLSEVEESGDENIPKKRNIAPDLSRRKMIKTTAATLLFGGTVLTPMMGSSSKSGSGGLGNKDYNPYGQNYNPYGEQYSPYREDYNPY